MIKPSYPSLTMLSKALTALIFTTVLAIPFANANVSSSQDAKKDHSNEPVRLYISLDDEKEGEEKKKILLLKNHQVISSNSTKDGKDSIKNGWKNIHPINCEENEKDCSWYAVVTDSKGKEGYINADGKWIIKPIYDTAKSFTDDRIARVQQGDRWHYINRKGDNIFNKTFAHASPFLQGYAVVIDEKSKKGAMVDTRYSSDRLQELYYIDVKGNKAFTKALKNGSDNFYKEVEMSGNVVVSLNDFSENGLAQISVGRKVPTYYISETATTKGAKISDIRYGYINTKGEITIKPEFIMAWKFNQFGIAEVSKIDDEYFLINEQGKPINKQVYGYIGDFSGGGIARAETKDGKFEGYINSKGEHLFEQDYSGGKEVNGRILTSRQFYDAKGNKVGEHLDWAKPFYDEEVTLARDDGKWGIINRDGSFYPFASNIVAPVTVEKDIYGFVDGLVAMIDDKQETVYFDRQGKVQYRFGKGQSKKGKSAKTGKMVLTDNTGKVLWQSDIDNQAIRNLFTPIKADFIKSEQYKKSGSIIPVVEAMINSKPKPYYIPNPVFDEEDETPYKVTEDAIENEEVQTGAVDIVAVEYVDEFTYGAYYDFISDVRGGVISAVHDDIKTEITQHYGKPSKSEEDYWNPLQWKIGNKTLSLSSQFDAGDGDYYQQIVLELNETKEQPKSNKE